MNESQILICPLSPRVQVNHCSTNLNWNSKDSCKEICVENREHFSFSLKVKTVLKDLQKVKSAPHLVAENDGVAH